MSNGRPYRWYVLIVLILAASSYFLIFNDSAENAKSILVDEHKYSVEQSTRQTANLENELVNPKQITKRERIPETDLELADNDNSEPVECTQYGFGTKTFFDSFNEEQKEQVFDWLKKRGYWINFENPEIVGAPNFMFDDYASYDEQTLIELAQQKDGKANLVLLFKNPNPFPRHEEITPESQKKAETLLLRAREAVISGYSIATMFYMGYYAQLHDVAKEKERQEETGKENREYAVRAAIWAQIGKQTQDFVVMEMGKMILESFQLTDKELLEVSIKSQEVWQRLSNERHERGLGDFDVSYPAILEPYVNCATQET